MGVTDSVMEATKDKFPPHPYYPLEAEIVGYLANEWSVPMLLASFAAGCAVIFATTDTIVKRIHPRLPRSELWTINWFVLSGCIHLFFEGESITMRGECES